MISPPSPSPSAAPGRRSRWLAATIVLLLLLGAGGALYWWLLPPTTPPQRSKPTFEVLMEANNRGVGDMERFDFVRAIDDFEKVVDMDPDWMPGRINLGIALMNSVGKVPENRPRAIEQFKAILADEPENLWAHFCLGVIFANDNTTMDEAAAHLEVVTQKDPSDAGGWYFLGLMLKNKDRARAIDCFRKTLQLKPYSYGALYNLQLLLGNTDKEEAKKFLAEAEALKSRHWEENLAPNTYGEMGRYGDVIGRVPNQKPLPTGPVPLFKRSDKFHIVWRSEVRWATVDDLRKEPQGELRAAVRERFGATLVVLDYNQDDKPDLLLLGAVVDKGHVRDLLLRNDGDGQFTDVTAEAGLDRPWPSLGCCVGDFDNDGLPDLLLTGIAGVRLLRNNGKGGFGDVTKDADLDQLKTVCLGAAFVDLDVDGALDLVVAQYATPESALAALKSAGAAQGGGLAVFENIGKAGPAPPNEKPPPLTPRFQRREKPDALVGPALPVTGVAVSDLDNDNDLDLCALADRQAPALVLNDRLMRFHRAALPLSLLDLPQGKQTPRWNGALVFDANRDGRSDLFLVSPDAPPVFLLNRHEPGQEDVGRWFERGATNAPTLLQAQAVDLDLDGWTDIVGLSADAPRRPVFLHNDGQRLVHEREALGADASWPADLVAVAVARFKEDCYPHFVTWSEKEGPALYENQGNDNHGLYLQLSGLRLGERQRTSTEPVGIRVTVHAEELVTGAEYTTLSAGLGQSLQPLLLGLAKHTQADVVRLRWPDNTLQAEFARPACQLVRIRQEDRRGVSCPVLFAWDGKRFGFLTDCLGAGSLGEMLVEGGYREPRPEESIALEARQLTPLHGEYVLKVAEPMDEITYLDRLQLVVVDHPAEVQVYPDERFATSGPPASQHLLAFRNPIFATRATDHHSDDVTKKLQAWDRDTVDNFARRTWLGITEEHWVELDFGDQLKDLPATTPLYLFLAGWTDYAYPESIYAAGKAGIALQPPLLERQDRDGRWETVAEIGFPAGLPRMMTFDLTGKLAGKASCVLRLRTNLEVYWDQIFLAPLLASPSSSLSRDVRVTELTVKSADVSHRGFMQEFSPDGRKPTLYDYDRLITAPGPRLSGRLTRYGDVTELLRERDDRFVIFGPGDEVTARFDANDPRLPKLESGWQRSFVLRTWGYCKDCGPFTATGATVGPLPFRKMRTYPYEKDQKYPEEAYDRAYNTRRVGPDRGAP